MWEPLLDIVLAINAGFGIVLYDIMDFTWP